MKVAVSAIVALCFVAFTVGFSVNERERRQSKVSCLCCLLSMCSIVTVLHVELFNWRGRGVTTVCIICVIIGQITRCLLYLYKMYDCVWCMLLPPPPPFYSYINKVLQNVPNYLTVCLFVNTVVGIYTLQSDYLNCVGNYRSIWLSYLYSYSNL